MERCFDISHPEAAPDNEEDRLWLQSVRSDGIATIGSIDIEFRDRAARKEKEKERVENQKRKAKEYEKVSKKIEERRGGV
jgi:hypothetical protein